MPSTSEIVEQIAAACVVADPTDLRGLADLHSLLETLGNTADTSAVKQSAQSAGTLVERIVLREVEDTAAALQKVGDAIAELQKIINDPGSGPQQEPLAESQASEEEQPTHDDPAELAERPILADDLPMVVEFVAEAGEHLNAAEAALLKLDADNASDDSVNAVFRSFHTIKGVAGFLNLRQIGALAHAAENLLDRARKGQLQLSGAVADITLESVDLAKALIAEVDSAARQNSAPRPDPRLAGLIQRLKIAAQQESAEPTARGASAPSEPVAAAEPAPAPVQPAQQPQEVSLEKSGERTHAEAQPKSPAHGTPSEPQRAKSSSGATSEATVKVATDRLDSLINMVGELVIAQSMVNQDLRKVGDGNPRLARNASHLGKLTRELQELSMSMRMIPIQGVFQKMARLVRDLAGKFGKQVNLELSGSETELDRNVVEAIGDPLVHMVRNALDHGIEPPDEREAAGKPRAGHVELRAYHQAGKIVIEIADDGRGLRKDKILKKAREAGIVRDGQELSEQEIFQLIFHAGLSTAEKVTDVSGRGVGMDVVRKNIEALRGRIEIASVVGKGSTFTIRLPLTLAVIDGLTVKVGNERYIIPITSVEQSMRPKAQQLSTVQGRGEMCLVRGELLPLYRLHRLFNVIPRAQDPTEALVVIVQDNERRCCLLVDELLGQQQVVIKSLGESIGSVSGVSGGAILGDGSICLILDVPGLIDLAGQSAAFSPPARLAA